MSFSVISRSAAKIPSRDGGRDFVVVYRVLRRPRPAFFIMIVDWHMHSRSSTYKRRRPRLPASPVVFTHPTRPKRRALPRAAAGVQKRNMSGIIEKQAAMQKGSTPYLRGEADPSWLRAGQTDNTTGAAILAFTAASWVFLGVYHVKMWNGWGKI